MNLYIVSLKCRPGPLLSDAMVSIEQAGVSDGTEGGVQGGDRPCQEGGVSGQHKA
jgi:hypothetical protein